MVENGPRTDALEERLRTAGIMLERRIATLETQMKIVIAVGGLLGSILSGVSVLLIIGVLR